MCVQTSMSGVNKDPRRVIIGRLIGTAIKIANACQAENFRDLISNSKSYCINGKSYLFIRYGHYNGNIPIAKKPFLPRVI